MNIFRTAKGAVIGLFAGVGVWRGMSWPVVVGTVALFVLHHWPEIVAEFTKVKVDLAAGDVPAVTEDLAKLKDQVNGLIISSAMQGKKS